MQIQFERFGECGTGKDVHVSHRCSDNSRLFPLKCMSFVWKLHRWATHMFPNKYTDINTNTHSHSRMRKAVGKKELSMQAQTPFSPYFAAAMRFFCIRLSIKERIAKHSLQFCPPFLHSVLFCDHTIYTLHTLYVAPLALWSTTLSFLYFIRFYWIKCVSWWCCVAVSAFCNLDKTHFCIFNGTYIYCVYV